MRGLPVYFSTGIMLVIVTSRDSSVGIATGYVPDGQGSNPVRGMSFSSPQRPDRLWGPPSLYPMDTGGLFLRGKAAGA
jgi:hypothetical protein